jgi:hypothetical protein
LLQKVSYFHLCNMKRYLAAILFLSVSLNSLAQNIDGAWRGTFIMYVHDVYDVRADIQRLPGDIFSARIKITNGFYKGEFQVSGDICNKKQLEITTIILIKENGGSNWIDCLNGNWELNDDENELTFTDTWLNEMARNTTCKVKYVQRDMFECMRSIYLYRVNFKPLLADFDDMWNNDTKKMITEVKKVVNKDTIIEQVEKVVPMITETEAVKKDEEKVTVIEKVDDILQREVNVKDEIFVSNKNILIEYWDRYREDGDTITLVLNGVPILKNILLTKAKKSIAVELTQNKNYLVLHAINLGTEPPNTATITVKDGQKIQNVMLNSDMKQSAALKITLRE